MNMHFHDLLTKIFRYETLENCRNCNHFKLTKKINLETAQTNEKIRLETV